ncbi:dicer-2 protein [Sporodiniella umbellata]|nr:dicer-2 protein [Sporodiniella umbellata]
MTDYVDETVRYVPLEHKENTMNNVDPSLLAKYLEPEFFDAKPDSDTKDLGFITLNDRERLDFDDQDDHSIEIDQTGAEKAAILAPREYQYELYQKALKENVITVLDTGTGKTLISVLLIKQMVHLERQARLTRRETKLAFFLVDRVPLVFQQASVIRANCDVALEYMCGEMDVDNWSEKKWKTIFEENDVCVMTAQIFLDALYSGFISIDKAHLIVFDECHHATKKHPFNLIMRLFYDRCAVENRPKIFGMTASPMHSKSSVDASVTLLEKNLNAHVYTASTAELKIEATKEIVINYSTDIVYEETEMTQKIRKNVGSLLRLKRCFVTIKDILSQLGPWCCDMMWKVMLTDLERRMTRQTQDLDRDALIDEDLALKETYELVDAMALPRNPDIKDRTLFTSKAALLVQLLLFWVGNFESFCGIIFVERRHTAVAIQKLIEAFDCLSPIQCGYLIGHGSSEEGDVRMSFEEQNRVIRKFRNGQINILVATNVAEEGLDIQPCNFVIRFDFFHTLIAYIQSRGRARYPKSKYIIMMDEKNTNNTSTLDEFRAMEEAMKLYCQALPAERNVAHKYSLGDKGLESDEEYDSDEDFLESAITDLETGATLTKHNAVPLIHRYCSSLPSDSFCVLKPIFEFSGSGEGYQCTLILPSNAALQRVESPHVRSKDLAKALAALQACAELKQVHALDRHLMPRNIRREILGEMEAQYDENGYVIGSRRRHGLYDKRTPKFWERQAEEEEAIDVEDDEDLLRGNVLKQKGRLSPVQDGPQATVETKDVSQEEPATDPIAVQEEELGQGPFPFWFTVLEVQTKDGTFEHRPYRRLCLMTRQPLMALPDLTLFHQSQPFTVKLRVIPTELSLSRAIVVTLSEYMMHLMRELMNKEYQCAMVDIPYFVVPFVQGAEQADYEALSPDALWALVDWEQVMMIQEQRQMLLDLREVQDVSDLIVIDRSDHFRRYVITQVSDELTPMSAIPEGRQFRDSMTGVFADAMGDRFKVTMENQPLLEVQRIKRTMNYLYPGVAVQAHIKGQLNTWVIPEFCSRYFIYASVYVAMLMVPSIMTRIDSLLLCYDARERYDLPINDQYMLEAYTMPSASMAMNYERLETLGDSLLKFIATIRLYINFPFSNEGELHHLRIRVVCNRAMYRAAKRLKFYRYVTSQTFNRRYWRPPHFKCAVDTAETREMLSKHRLSDKTLADIVEASLGAGYLSQGLEGCLHTAIQLQIPFDEIKCWADFNRTFRELRKTVPARAEIKALRLLDVARVQSLVGHGFESPLLMVEALTHASLPNATAPCYQRLEFLGDAILDFLVIRYLYTTYPQAEPGEITTLKDSCVNNHVLGIICLNQGLHKHIIHYSGKLIRSIEFLENEVRELKACGRDVGEYWAELNIPKVLSDVVESMLGALFVDAEFNLAPCEKLFERWFVPVFQQHVTPERVKIHPMRKLLTDLQAFGCDGFMLRNHSTGSTGPESQKCVVFLHDQPLACGSDWNIKVARRRAAEKASQRLADEPTLLDQVCNCRVATLRRGLEEEEEDLEG